MFLTNMLVLRTLNFQGVTIRPTVPRKTPCCLYCLSRASSKLILNYFQLFQIKVVTAKCSIVCFQCSRLFTEKFLRASTIHPSIFGGRQHLIKIVFLSRVKLEKETVKTPLNTISIVYFRYARLFTAKFSRTSTILPLESGENLVENCKCRVSPRHAPRDQFKPIRL